MEYKVTNKLKDVRKFRDSFSGKDIFVEPKKFIFTNNPPKESDVWKVENIEELEKKKKIIKSREVKKMKEKKLEDDSRSNR